MMKSSGKASIRVKVAGKAVGTLYSPQDMGSFDGKAGFGGELVKSSEVQSPPCLWRLVIVGHGEVGKQRERSPDNRIVG